MRWRRKRKRIVRMMKLDSLLVLVIHIYRTIRSRIQSRKRIRMTWNNL